MSLDACAALVQRGDPDRFLAAMAAPPPARRVLFPLYAFNIEVARAPWVSAEPMIAEMRLQWWRDALEEIAAGGPVRRHEVATELAGVLDGPGARLLDALVEARRRDLEPAPFEDGAAMEAYLDATAGNLAWTAARALGADDGEAAVRGRAWAAGLARWLQAVPLLEARGRRPLPDGRPQAVRDWAEQGLRRLSRAGRVPPAARPAVLDCWQAGPLLRQARRAPARVAQGRLALSEFRRRLGLIRYAGLGR